MGWNSNCSKESCVCVEDPFKVSRLIGIFVIGFSVWCDRTSGNVIFKGCDMVELSTNQNNEHRVRHHVYDDHLGLSLHHKYVHRDFKTAKTQFNRSLYAFPITVTATITVIISISITVTSNRSETAHSTQDIHPIQRPSLSSFPVIHQPCLYPPTDSEGSLACNQMVQFCYK